MSRDRLLRQSLRARFLVTLKSGQSFDGLLREVDDETLLLVDAFQVSTDGPRVKVDGSLYVPRGEVDYMQKPEVRA